MVKLLADLFSQRSASGPRFPTSLAGGSDICSLHIGILEQVVAHLSDALVLLLVGPCVREFFPYPLCQGGTQALSLSTFTLTSIEAQLKQLLLPLLPIFQQSADVFRFCSRSGRLPTLSVGLGRGKLGRACSKPWARTDASDGISS